MNILKHILVVRYIVKRAQLSGENQCLELSNALSYFAYIVLEEFFST